MTLEIATLIVSVLVLAMSTYSLVVSRRSYLRTKEAVKKLEDSRMRELERRDGFKNPRPKNGE